MLHILYNMAGQQNESSDLILNLPDNNALYCDKSSDNNEYDVSSVSLDRRFLIIKNNGK